MKKLAAVFLAVSIFFAPALHAQSAPAKPAVAAAAVDPATVAAVHELLAAMKYREVMLASFIQMEQGMPAMMTEAVAAAVEKNPKLTPEQKKLAIDKAAKEIPPLAAAFGATFRDPKLMEELLAEIVPLYARHFTADELRQMAVFYQTPVGAKMLFLTPRISHEAMQISQKIVLPRISAAIGKLTADK